MRNIKLLALVMIVKSLGTALCAQDVKHTGAMRQVMTGASLQNTLLWDTLSPEKLYGIGPLDRLNGEVTVVDGIIYTAKVNGAGDIVTMPVTSAAATFGVYINLENEVGIRVSEEIKDIETLERLIQIKAEQAGLDAEKPFLFVVKGQFDWIKVHVLNKPADELEHNHDLHNQAKKYFEYQNIGGELIGFYSRQHEGVFTHRGQYTHVHFISRDKSVMGHLDGIRSVSMLDILFSRS
jgi:acetolactate decarboxylase